MSKLTLIERAHRFCEINKFRLTKPRIEVLRVLALSGEPMKAYALLEALSCSSEKVNPPTIYRAIDFWCKHGFIHRIESMNAYVSCCGHELHDNFCIFICDECHVTLELPLTSIPLSTKVEMKNNNLFASRANTEIHGRCGKCHV